MIWRRAGITKGQALGLIEWWVDVWLKISQFWPPHDLTEEAPTTLNDRATRLVLGQRTLNRLNQFCRVGLHPRTKPSEDLAISTD